MRKGSHSEELVKIDLHVENPSLPPRSTEGTVTRRGVARREQWHQVKLNLRKGIRAISLSVAPLQWCQIDCCSGTGSGVQGLIKSGNLVLRIEVWLLCSEVKLTVAVQLALARLGLIDFRAVVLRGHL